MVHLAVFIFLWIFLLPRTAFAHSPNAGFEGFYSGLLHPLKETAQGLSIVALGFLVGQQPNQYAKKAAAAFLLALIAGLVVAFVIRSLLVPDLLFFLLAMTAGILVAFYRPVGPVSLISFASATGIASGVISMPDPGTLSAMAFTISGSLVGAILLFVYAFGGAHWVVSRAERPWLSIGLRILGSWIAAACALMLALAVSA